MVNNNAFDNDLRSRFEGFAPEPPPEAWLAIEEGLVVVPGRRLLPVFFKVAAAIAFLAIGGLSIWLINSERHPGSQIADSQTHIGSAAIPDADDNTSAAATPEISAPVTGRQADPQSQSGSSIIRDRGLMASASGESTDGLAAKTKHIPISDPDQALIAVPGADAFGFLAMDRILLSRLSYGQATLLTPKHKTTSKTSSMFASNLSNTAGEGFNTRGPRTTGIVLGVHIAPQYADRHIAEPFSNLPLGILENHSMDYGFGITASIAVSPRLSIQTGLGYMNVNQHITDISAFSHIDNNPFYDAEFSPGYGHPQNIVTSFGIIRMDSPGLYFTDTQSSRVLMSNTKIPFNVPDDPKFLTLQGQNLTQFFRFVEVPVILRYTLLEHRFVSLSLKAGVAGNFLVRNDVVLSGMNNNQEVIGETFGVRDFSYSGIGGFAFTFPVTSRLHLFVEPTAQMFLQPIAKENALPSADSMSTTTGKTYPYCFSVNSGISFRF